MKCSNLPESCARVYHIVYLGVSRKVSGLIFTTIFGWPNVPLAALARRQKATEFDDVLKTLAPVIEDTNRKIRNARIRKIH